MAGATVWAVLIPSALSYAVMVGIEPIVGLDTTGFTAFMELNEELAARGVELRVVHPLARTWAKVERHASATGKTLPPMFGSVDDAISNTTQLT